MAFSSTRCTTLEFGYWLFQSKHFCWPDDDFREASKSGNDFLYLFQFCILSEYYHLILTDYCSNPCDNLRQPLLEPNLDSI
jgi:hypothetical protein